MSTSDKICNVGASKSDDAGVCELEEKLNKMSTADDNVSVCANCGKEDAKNICNKCKVTTYCNAVCKKVHKKKHKKECEEYIRHAAEKHNEELRIAAKLRDEKLFTQPPPEKDCPICFERLPSLYTGSSYQSCCGKRICTGCVYAPLYDNQGNEVDNHQCPFCRIPAPYTQGEAIERQKKRMEANDPTAMYNLGVCYRDGLYGYQQDHTKALELWHKAAELDHTPTYLNIGYAYDNGDGVEVDKEKALHYYELAAIGGDVIARYNLGVHEEDTGNMNRALKHHMIAVRSGFAESLERVKKLYSKGHATKDNYTKALRLYQVYLGEIKSPQREKAAAYNDRYQYY